MTSTNENNQDSSATYTVTLTSVGPNRDAVRHGVVLLLETLGDNIDQAEGIVDNTPSIITSIASQSQLAELQGEADAVDQDGGKVEITKNQ